MDDLKVVLWPLVGIFVLFVVTIIVFGLRNKVFFRMGARNLPRRPANSLLICLGLMLAAMIFSASFATGDTLHHTIRTSAVDRLGEVDIMVMREGVAFGGESQEELLDGSTQTQYFDQSQLEDVVAPALADLRRKGTVEGIAPAIIQRKPVMAFSTGLNEPMVTVLGLDYRYMEPFDPLVDQSGTPLSLERLEDKGGGHVYINQELAEKLSDPSHTIGIGDELVVFLKSAAATSQGISPLAQVVASGTRLTIAGIYEKGGNPTTFNFASSTQATLVMPLAELQSLRASQIEEASPNEIGFILITNRGGAIDGANPTDEVLATLEPALEGTGFRIQAVKQDELNDAEEVGSQISTMFLVFGSFSIIAGVLLIFLIFVMLAAERKQELGMTRAIGAQRGHIIRMFTFEGVLYALIASGVGAGLGLFVCWGMIQIMQAALEELGIEIIYYFTTSGLIISYTLGVVLTVLVVFFSARRVSQLNIISAIKDIPEPVKVEQRTVMSIITSILLPLVALIMLVSGLQSKDWAPYSLGASLLIIGVFMLARRYLKMPERMAYTLTGVFLLIFWLVPDEYHPYGDEMNSGIELFILSGVMMVAGAVWVVMYNSDVLLKTIMTLLGHIRVLAPILKTAISYPLASRFRTGMAVAMFSLVVFTLVVMSVINASFNHLLDDTERVTGGFDIRAGVVNPIPDINRVLENADELSPTDFEAIGGISAIPLVRMRDADQGGEWVDFPLMGIDAAHLDSVNYDFHLKARSYRNASKEDMWQALKNNPSLAVVTSMMVPARGGGPGEEDIDLVIGEGRFYLNDDYMPDDIFIELENPDTQEIQRLQVIGVLDVLAIYAGPVTTSQETLNLFWGSEVPANAYRFRVAEARKDDVTVIAKALERNFLASGMNTEVLETEIEDFSKINNMFMNLMMAFMGLGLIVGIAALGVIAARSVVERRHQIGMLRAIGFRQGMVQASFLLESSFVSILGITLGVILGVALSYQMIPDWDVEGITAVVPWFQIVLITVLAYLASLLTTFLPAYRAAKVYPAEALRYE